MSQLEFNVKAKFVYTKLLPLVQEASRDLVEGMNYEARDDEETLVLLLTKNRSIRMDVTGRSLACMTTDVLEAVCIC